MKKIIDDPRLIYKACCLYYEDGMKQEEIGGYLGISRSSVLRMLQTGVKMGIVQIKVVNPASLNYGKHEKALEEKYGLKNVLVVENGALDPEKNSAAEIYEKAADFLFDFFHEGDCIGVSMGNTLNNVVKTNRRFAPKNLKFVPMIGGLSQSTVGQDDIQSNEIARKFARKFGGTYTQFLSPAVFSQKRVLEYFLQEKSVNFIFNEFERVNVVVMGIGIPERADSTLIRAGYAGEDELEQMARDGVAGDISLLFYDREGSTEKFRRFNDRVAAMGVERIRKVPARIGIAAGAKKADAVLAAIRGGFINILITDAECAKRLL